MTNQEFSARLIEVNSLFTFENNRQTFSLFYVLKGSFICQKKNDEFMLKNHQLIINNSGEKIIFKQQSQQNILLHLEISFSEIEKIIKQAWHPFFRDDRLEMVTEDDRQLLVEHLLRLCLDFASEENQNQLFSRTVYLLSFLEQLNKIVLIEKQGAGGSVIVESSHPKIQEVLNYVESYYTRRLSLQEIAKQAFLSEAYLSRLFKEETGTNFSDYVDLVRLKHGVHELRTSQLPILTIALNSGFSSSKRFSNLFKEKYGVTPSEYRKSSEATGAKDQQTLVGQEDFELIVGEDMLQIIAQFMLNENIKKETEDLPTQYDLVMSEDESNILTKPEKIINIGQAENGITEDVRYQIRLLQDKIPFEYIRFFGLCTEVEHQQYVIMDKHVNNHRLFSFINEMRLKPIIVLEITAETSYSDWQKELAYLRKVIQGYVHFEASFRSGWYLEIKFPKNEKLENYSDFYQYAYQFLQSNFTTGFIGVTISSNKQDEFKNLYQKMLTSQKIPRFISYNFSNSSSNVSPDELTLIESLDNLLFWLGKSGSQRTPDVLLTEWNILASDTHVLSGTFFRAGIIMKTLITLATRVTCVGFWLNLESEKARFITKQDGNLSLFLYGPLKRPLFFVLTLFERVGDQIISENDKFILTKRFNSYYLLFYNYDFLNPEDTAYKNLWKSSKKEVIFHFNEIKNGSYLIKKFLLDSNHGGIYNQWLKSGGTVAVDTDIQEYLLQSVVPDFEVKELEISDGYLEEQTSLEINSCYLLIMNRIPED